MDLGLERRVRLLQGNAPAERMPVLASRNHISFVRTTEGEAKLRAAGAAERLPAKIPAPPTSTSHAPDNGDRTTS